MKRLLHGLALMTAFLLSWPLAAQELQERYGDARPVVIVCDWEKPPYEFLDDNGNPAGSNIDIMQAVMQRLGLPCKFVMKEWNIALKTFERGDADLILANGGRYRMAPYVVSQNIVNYNRICVALCDDTVGMVPLQKLQREGAVFKPGDYSALYFRDGDSTTLAYMDFQTPKVALTGLLAGDYKYFIWGEEPLKWKIKELNLEGISLADVSIPVSEIHIIGRDRELIEAIDDEYSRMKQSGGIEDIQLKWAHLDRTDTASAPSALLIFVALVLLAVSCLVFNRLAHARVLRVTRSSTELNEMMLRALHMGNFDVMVYDIRRDHITNSYGNILPPEGLTLEEFTERIHPDQRDEFRRKMGRLIEGRERSFELDKKFRAGTSDAARWLNLRGHAIVELDPEGHPAFVVNAIRDVTDAMREDGVVSELVHRYERLSNQPFIAMSFYDSEGWILGTNEQMRALCHYDANNGDAERFWTKVCMFDIPLFRGVYSPDEKNELRVCQHMEYPELGIDIFIEIGIQPMLDDNGDIVNYYVTTDDVSDDRERVLHLRAIDKDICQTNLEITRQLQRLIYLLRKSDRYIMRTDMVHQLISFYQTPDAPEYEHTFDHFLNEMIAEADRPVASSRLYDTVTTTPQTYLVHLMKRSEGQLGSYFQINYNPVCDAKGNIVGREGVSSDITKLYQAREYLSRVTELAKDSTRMKSGFMASMTHELRTPLNAIVGFASILQMDADSADRPEYVRILRNNCDMLQRLIDDIIEASSLTDGPTTVHPQPVNFASAFEDMCMMVHTRMSNPNISFIKDNPYTTYYTTLDTGRIQQVLTNFVINASKFTESGHIRLGYRERDGGLYFFCEDTGCGIPKDKQDIIFERFVKLDEFVQGTGMGLAICKSIVERMGGRIGVDSEGEGRGSTFWMWVPCEHHS